MTQVASSHIASPPHYMEKGLRDLFPLNATEVILLIVPSLNKGVSSPRSSDWRELARSRREGNGARHP